MPPSSSSEGARRAGRVSSVTGLLAPDYEQPDYEQPDYEHRIISNGGLK